jgi:hypothetical protein
MEKTHSWDGTAVGYWRSGSGPALLLVHGTTADHTRWAPLLPRPEPHFTVYSMDRGGRGGSGDSPDYYIPLRGLQRLSGLSADGRHLAAERPRSVFGEGALECVELDARRLAKRIWPAGWKSGTATQMISMTGTLSISSR